MEAYIGIDLGTSGAKLLLVTAEGAILKECVRTYSLTSPRVGWTEQDPQQWLDAVYSGLSELLCGYRCEVKGLSVGGQMHGLVVLDGADNVIRPCILWNDGRTEKQTVYLNEVVGREKLINLTGNIAFAGFTAPKLLWLKENEPENFSRISKIMLPKDYIIYKLTGEFSTDYSDASGTLLLDVRNKKWSEEMCGICGICAAQLPKLRESYSPCGILKEEVQKKLGLDFSVIVAAGAGDNAAAAVGTGTVYSGGCNISLGTSGTLFIPCKQFTFVSDALHSFAHADGAFHVMGCILSAASANKWWTEDILRSDYALAEKARGVMGRNQVFFLPYLSGERSPHNDVNARGAFIGMNAGTTAAEMSLAVMEGVAFAFRDCLETAKRGGICVQESTICGGGAKSALWRTIMADVLNITISTVETEQGPAYGAAMLAMVACGRYKSVEEAAKNIVKRKISAVPEKELAEEYDGRYAAFTKLYPALKGWFAEVKNC